MLEGVDERGGGRCRIRDAPADLQRVTVEEPEGPAHGCAGGIDRDGARDRARRAARFDDGPGALGIPSERVAPPRRLVFRDGFANDDGSPNSELPGLVGTVLIEEIGAGRTRMTIRSQFPSIEAMEQVLAMGMEEGLTGAVGQIDAILAGDPAPVS